LTVVGCVSAEYIYAALRDLNLEAIQRTSAVLAQLLPWLNVGVTMVPT
jgi:hypothetical protein